MIHPFRTWLADTIMASAYYLAGWPDYRRVPQRAPFAAIQRANVDTDVHYVPPEGEQDTSDDTTRREFEQNMKGYNWR